MVRLSGVMAISWVEPGMSSVAAGVSVAASRKFPLGAVWAVTSRLGPPGRLLTSPIVPPGRALPQRELNRSNARDKVAPSGRELHAVDAAFGIGRGDDAGRVVVFVKLHRLAVAEAPEIDFRGLHRLAGVLVAPGHGAAHHHG